MAYIDPKDYWRATGKPDVPGGLVETVGGAAGSANWDPMRTYFATSQSGEYKNNPAAMQAFAGMYGPQATSLLGYTGKSPEGIDPNLNYNTITPSQLRRIGTAGQFYNTPEEIALQNLHSANVMPTDFNYANIGGSAYGGAASPYSRTTGSTGAMAGSLPASRTNPAEYYNQISRAKAAAGAQAAQAAALRNEPVAAGTQYARGMIADPNATTDVNRSGTAAGTSSTGGTVGTATGGTAAGTGSTTTAGNTFSTVGTGSNMYNIPSITATTGTNMWPQTPEQGGNFVPKSLDDFWNVMAPEQWQWLNNLLQNQTVNSGNLYNQSTADLNAYLQAYNPASLTAPLLQMLNQMSQNPLSGDSTLAQIQSSLQGLLSQTPGANAGSNYLLGGTGAGDPYGLLQLYNQIMTQGLPNQQGIQNLTSGQTTFGQQQQGNAADWLQQMQSGQGNVPTNAAEAAANQKLTGMIQGTGLTPEYIAAMRKQVLEPQQEAMMGNLNQLAGGSAMLTSPAYQELLRRNEESFTNQLIASGMQNLQGYIGQGLQAGGQQQGYNTNMASQLAGLGQQGIGNALAGFTGVASAASPYLQQAANLQGQLSNQDLSTYYAQLQGLQTGQNIAMSPYNFNQQQQFGTYDRGSNLLNQILGTYSGQQNNMLQSYLGNLGASTSMTNNLTSIGGQQNLAKLMADLQGGQLTQQQIGSLIANALSAQQGGQQGGSSSGVDWGSVVNSIGSIFKDILKNDDWRNWSDEQWDDWLWNGGGSGYGGGGWSTGD